MLERLKTFKNLNGIAFRLFSLLLFKNAAFYQNWQKRRQAERNNCHISVEVLHGNHRFDAVIRNISPYGARLDLVQNCIEKNDRIALKFPLHYLEPPVDTEARVVWSEYGSAGIEFDVN